MKKFAVVFLTLIMLACGQPRKEYVVQGTVRNVWCHEDLNGRYCNITFEHDADLSYTVITVSGNVPVWKDERVVMRIESTGAGIDNFVSARRLP